MMDATPKQYASLIVFCASYGARREGRNPVKALNDARTDILSGGDFSEHNLAALSLIDQRIAELIPPKWQWH